MNKYIYVYIIHNKDVYTIIKKYIYMYIYNEMLPLEKEWNVSICNNLGGYYA